MSRRTGLSFRVWSIGVWLLMVGVLVIVPDTLEQWIPLHLARVVGWVLASGLWVAILEREWRDRFSPVPRFFLQALVWLAAALTAAWISEQFRVRY
ncbi:MAG TPA: hypothetical protein VFV78_10040 [Vicinamibacterales bacterium]|nr:hypothetical protein [Vicinamibacterales bacterium]